MATILMVEVIAHLLLIEAAEPAIPATAPPKPRLETTVRLSRQIAGPALVAEAAVVPPRQPSKIRRAVARATRQDPAILGPAKRIRPVLGLEEPGASPVGPPLAVQTPARLRPVLLGREGVLRVSFRVILCTGTRPGSAVVVLPSGPYSGCSAKGAGWWRL